MLGFSQFIVYHPNATHMSPRWGYGSGKMPALRGWRILIHISFLPDRIGIQN